MFLKAKEIKKIDYKLLISVLILLVLGLLMIQSSSSIEGLTKHGDGAYFTKRQAMYVGLGLVVMAFMAIFNHENLKILSLPIFLVSFFLNILLFTSLGDDRYGSTRWLNIGGLPSFMPSEVLKLGAIIFVSALVSQFREKIKNPRQVAFVTMVIALSVGIVVARDLGSATVLGFSLMAILFLAGIKIKHLIVICIGVIIAAIIFVMSPRFSYRRRRLVSFLDPFNPTSDSYHLVNTLYAVAMGGIFGQGVGQGVQKFAHIPNVFSDSIFAVIGEELGLVGSFAVVVLYIYIVFKAFIIARNTDNLFSKSLAVGIGSSIGIQALIHIFVNIGLAPITGITLPFISYGGSSILISMAMVGILLNISARSSKK